MDIIQAEKIMGKNLIGPKELKKISSKFSILVPDLVPEIPFDLEYLDKIKQDYLLVLGNFKTRDGGKLTINKMRLMFGWNPEKSEPCFYNQDWYLKEKFANESTLDFKWHLIKKIISEDTRGKNPEKISEILKEKESFPSAILTVFTFFAYYLLTKGEILWKNDFIWCSDKDANGDRVYTGRYEDSKRINKNGFNIHRHLSIRSCYGVAPQII